MSGADNEFKSFMVKNFADGCEGKQDTAVMRDRALDAVKTFKAIKKAIWQTCNIWNIEENEEI